MMRSGLTRVCGLAARLASRTRTAGLCSAAVSDDLLAEIGKLGTQAAVDALWLEGYPQPYIHGARPLAKGAWRREKINGEARLLVCAWRVGAYELAVGTAALVAGATHSANRNRA